MQQTRGGRDDAAKDGIRLLLLGQLGFYAVALVNTPGSKTLPVGLLLFQGQYFTDRGAQFAGLVLATIPVVALYAVFQRQITQGFSLGGYR